MYIDFIRLFKSGDPVRNVSNAEDHNRIANILNDVGGVGCHWEKPSNGEGSGWQVVVDGTTSDRYVAVDTANNPNYLSKLWKDTAASGADDVLVYRDAIQDTAPSQLLRMFVKSSDLDDTEHTTNWGDLATTPQKVLTKDTAGTVGWSTITLTAIDFAPQLRLDTGNQIQVRALKGKLAVSAGAIVLASDTYGGWAGISAGPCT